MPQIRNIIRSLFQPIHARLALLLLILGKIDEIILVLEKLFPKLESFIYHINQNLYDIFFYLKQISIIIIFLLLLKYLCEYLSSNTKLTNKLISIGTLGLLFIVLNISLAQINYSLLLNSNQTFDDIRLSKDGNLLTQINKEDCRNPKNNIKAISGILFNQNTLPSDDFITQERNVQLEELETYKSNKDFEKIALLCPYEPEPFILINNKKIANDENKITIATSLPIRRAIQDDYGNQDSKEILRGIAIAQKEWNSDQSNPKVFIEIIDDGYTNNNNEEEIPKAIAAAKYIVDQDEILGVIGHFSSDATEKASIIYEKKHLVAISPTSTAVRINTDQSNLLKTINRFFNKNINCSYIYRDRVCFNSYIFRTSPDDDNAALNLHTFLGNNLHTSLGNNRSENSTTYPYFIGIIYEQKSVYSRSIKSAFIRKFRKNLIANKRNINIDKCNLDSVEYSLSIAPQECLNQLISNKKSTITHLLLIPTTKNTVETKNAMLSDLHRSQDLNLKYLGGDGMYKNQITEENIFKTEATNKLKVAVPWHKKQDIKNEQAYCKKEENLHSIECKSYRTFKTTDINWRTATAYDATKALLYGVKETVEDDKCNSYDSNNCIRKNLNEVLLSNTFQVDDGALGEIKFKSNGDREEPNNIQEDFGVVVEVKDDNNGQVCFKRLEDETNCDGT